jgi:hypothetical protein
MYDPGLETSDAGLYGTEYLYQNSDGSCSGVAANEPGIGEEENALIGYLDTRTAQSGVQQIIAGRDKEQHEGPIGQGVLPGPAVGYARVIAKNIHEGTTNNGFTVKEFFTAKDYPYDKDYSYTDADNVEHTYKGVDKTSINKEIDNPWALNVLSPIIQYKVWATQGYRFIINNMHGQPKLTATYLGDYANISDITKLHCSSSQQFTYYEPGEPLKMVRNWEWDSNTTDDDLHYEWFVPGKQMEVVSESKMITDSTVTAALEIDFSVGACGPAILPYPTIIPYMSLNLSKLHSEVTTKVINYPSIVKSVRSTQDGMISFVSNEYFDARTGVAIVTSVNDGYNGLLLAGNTAIHNGAYYNYNFLAPHYYDNLQQKSLTEAASFGGEDGDCTITKSGNELTVLGADACDCIKFFSPGDLISLSPTSSSSTISDIEVYHVGEINGGYIELLANTNFNYDLSSSGDVSVQILESGKKNMLTANVGGISSYGGEAVATTYGISYQDLRNRTEYVATSLNLMIPTAVGGSGRGTLSSTFITIFDNEGECSPLNETFIITKPTETELRINFNDECIASVAYNADYQFFINQNDGELMYGAHADADCAFSLSSCLDFCPDPYTKLTGVVSASANVLSDDWSLEGTSVYDLYNFRGENVYQQGAKGHWLPKSSYGYYTVRSNIEDNLHSWNTGIFEDFTVFNWQSIYNNDSAEWIMGGMLNTISPNCFPLEEQNILGTKTIAKYSNDFALPYVVANNTAYDNVMFEGFENYSLGCNTATTYCFEDGYSLETSNGEISSDYSHSGNNSWKLALSSSGSYLSGLLPLKSIVHDEQINEYGINLKCWLRLSGSSTDPFVELRISSQQFEFEKVARVGEWILYSVNMPSYPTDFTPSIYVRHTSLAASVYIDDIRMQPTNSSSTAYVYDQTNFKLLTQFDDQNFGLFYQYDAEGKLVRKMAETERGIKTISEQQSHVPTVSR